jgi:hypothetical protein
MFKPISDSIQFLFCGHSGFYLVLHFTLSIKISLLFTWVLHNNTHFNVSLFMWHFGTSNTTEWTFDIAAGAWDYVQRKKTHKSSMHDSCSKIYWRQYWRGVLMCIGYWPDDCDTSKQTQCETMWITCPSHSNDQRIFGKNSDDLPSYYYISASSCINIHVRWVPCYHGMTRPRVADAGNDLQIWRVAANILNKQSWTANKGWSSSLGVGRGANNSP